MTTIAYKDGILAADTQGDWGGTRVDARKIYRGPGFVLAGAGTAWRVQESFDLAEKMVGELYAVSPSCPDRACLDRAWRHLASMFYEPHFDKWPDETPNMLLIQPSTGNVVWLRGPRFRAVTLGHDCVAIGSGSEYALGAMAAGASAADAVRIAISLDVHSGGEIEVLNVKELRP